MFFHSSSYTADSIACAAAKANLAIWRDEPVLERIADLTRRQARRLASLAPHAGVRNGRQSGTITAIEIGDANSYLSEVAPGLLAMFANETCYSDR